MRTLRATGKIQWNNYHHENCGPSLPRRVLLVSLIFTHQTHRNVKNRKVRIALTLSGPGGGGAESAPLRFFLHNSKTTGDIEKKLSDFNFTPLMDILRILSMTIVVRCCHSNLLFKVCHVIFGLKKQRNLNYFQDNYLIKLKFGTWGYF